MGAHSFHGYHISMCFGGLWEVGAGACSKPGAVGVTFILRGCRDEGLELARWKVRQTRLLEPSHPDTNTCTPHVRNNRQTVDNIETEDVGDVPYLGEEGIGHKGTSHSICHA